MRIKLSYLYILLCMLIHLPAQASLTATLDKPQTSLDQPVHLTIVSDRKQGAQEIDLSTLEKDFDIIGQSSSSEISTLNGVASSKSVLLLILKAKREGELKIPVLSLGNDQTESLSLTVTATSLAEPVSQADGDTPDVFIETIWEHPGKAYVQSQLNLLIRIYHRGNLLEAALDEPRAENTLVKHIGDDVQSTHRKHGVLYQTIERRYALFPQKSGDLLIPPVTLQVRLPDPRGQNSRRFGFGSFLRGKQLSLRSKPLSIDVYPPAKEFTGSFWLPSTQLTLTRSGLPEQAIHPGDAINLQIDLSALGLTGAQLPEVKISNPNNQFKLYPDEPNFSDSTADGKTIKGKRSQTFVLIAPEADTLEIPKISVAWWDVKNDRQQYASLAAVSIDVLAVNSTTEDSADIANVSANRKPLRDEVVPVHEPQTSSSDGSVSVWNWLSVFSLSGWLLTIAWFVFYYTRIHRSRKNSNAIQTSRDLSLLLTTIRNAADENDAQKTWHALQEYARARWPEHPPGAPEEWAQLPGLSKGAQAIAELDEHLYRRSGNLNWNGEAVRRLLLPKLDTSSLQLDQTRLSEVPSLYPSA